MHKEKKPEMLFSTFIMLSLGVVVIASFLIYSNFTALNYSSHDTALAFKPTMPSNQTTSDVSVISPTNRPPEQALTTGLHFNASNFATDNTIFLDSDAENLVILMPDKRLVTQDFIPMDATIVEGTKVIWVNGDRDAVHGITLKNSNMEVLLHNETISYLNGTEYTFETQGTYTYSDPRSPFVEEGEITVVAPENVRDNISTNSTQPTVGLFVVQAVDKDYFDMHFNTSGYHIDDSYMIPGPEGNDIELYVYTQKFADYPTILERTALKLQYIDSETE